MPFWWCHLGYKLRVAAFVRGGLWDRGLRVDVRRAVKMLSRKVECISVCVTHPFCKAGHRVCVQLLSLGICSAQLYICICKTDIPFHHHRCLVADLMDDVPYCSGPCLLVYFLIIMKFLWNIPVCILWMQRHIPLRSCNIQSPFPIAVLTASLCLRLSGGSRVWRVFIVLAVLIRVDGYS